MATVFDDLLVKGVRQGHIPARTEGARDWFRTKAQKVGRTRVQPEDMLRENKKVDQVRIGNMYHFKYDPKGKKTLPYYDTFPLIFMVGAAEGGFYGLNLHYLPPRLRAKLMDELYGLASNNRYDEKTKLMISYKILQSASKMKYFKPTFKHYLADHVKSKFIKVDSAEWDIALFLPTSRFKYATTQKVYSDSRKQF